MCPIVIPLKLRHSSLSPRHTRVMCVFFKYPSSFAPYVVSLWTLESEPVMERAKLTDTRGFLSLSRPPRSQVHSTVQRECGSINQKPNAPARAFTLERNFYFNVARWKKTCNTILRQHLLTTKKREKLLTIIEFTYNNSIAFFCGGREMYTCTCTYIHAIRIANHAN